LQPVELKELCPLLPEVHRQPVPRRHDPELHSGIRDSR
jgi:hypothetical protein